MNATLTFQVNRGSGWEPVTQPVRIYGYRSPTQFNGKLNRKGRKQARSAKRVADEAIRSFGECLVDMVSVVKA